VLYLMYPGLLLVVFRYWASDCPERSAVAAAKIRLVESISKTSQLLSKKM
jgi:hypothetical protein